MKDKISVLELERRMEILHDIKKEITYSKYAGTWDWHDCYGNETDDLHGPFPTFWLALCDATNPYFNESE